MSGLAALVRAFLPSKELVTLAELVQFWLELARDFVRRPADVATILQAFALVLNADRPLFELVFFP